MQYRFSFDSLAPITAVTGWESLTLSYEMEGYRGGVSASGGIGVAEAAVYAYLQSLGPCQTVTVLIEYQNPASAGFEPLISLLVPMSKVTFDTRRKIAALSLESSSVLQRAREREAEAAQIEPTQEIDLKQPWSFGDLGLSANSVALSDLLTELLGRAAPGSTYGGDLLGATAPGYAPEVWEVSDIPAIVSGDTLRLEITNAFGDTHICILESRAAGYTGGQAANRLKNTLLFSECNAGTVYPWSPNELIAKAVSASSSGDTLTMTFHYPVLRVSLTLNGGASGATVRPRQVFQYSLKNLQLGRTDNEKIKISLKEIFDLLDLFRPVFIEDGAEEINLFDFDREINRATPTLTLSDRAGEVSAVEEIKARAVSEHAFSLSGYFSYLQSWKWIGQKTAITIPASQTFFNWAFSGSDGPYIISGGIEIELVSFSPATVFIEVINSVTGELLATSSPYAISQSNSPHTFKDWLQTPFCLNSGDNLSILVNTIPAATFGTTIAQTTGAGSLSLEEAICFNSPNTREDRPESKEGKFPDFSLCGGQFENQLKGGFYGGLGFAWDQIANEAQDYENTTHLLLTDGAGELEEFSLQVYTRDSANACECYRRTTQTYYFSNLILQPRYQLLNFSKRIPAGLELQAYQIEKTCNSGNNYSESTTIKNVLLFPPHSRLERVKFADVQTPAKFAAMARDRAVTADGIGERSGRAVVRKTTFTLGSGISENEIEI
jgi:hypothetical protein